MSSRCFLITLISCYVSWRNGGATSRNGLKKKIRQEAVQRRIPYLVHFTQVRNLASIVTHGLLSREHLLAHGLGAFVSANHRLDDKDEAISVSISAINFEIFKAKQAAWRGSAWVVLFLDPSILWTHNCRFLSRNAARRTMKEHRGFLGGPGAFFRCF